jgi:protein gp37
VFFTNSMSDLFYEGADPADVLVIIDVMQRCPRHVFQVLTKRPEHAAAFLARHGIVLSHNIWLGVSVESANYKSLSQ